MIRACASHGAAHRIPLNEIGEPFLVTTGRRLREEGWPEGVDTVVVLLDAGTAFQAIDAPDLQIWWGAYLGMANEIIIAGRLAEVGATIAATRAEARARHGWIMDVYVLKRAWTER
jgi:precorrin-6A synthase